MILGDSMVTGLNEYGSSKNHNIKIQSFAVYATEDMLDTVKPTARHKPNIHKTNSRNQRKCSKFFIFLSLDLKGAT